MGRWPGYYLFAHGLKYIAKKFLRKVLLQESATAIEFISKLEPRSINLSHTMGPTDRVSDKPSEICYLLAAAGSGKTHRMFKMLEEKFGFYIVSGRVGDQENRQDVGDYLYQPRASIASGDAKLLTRILERGRTSPYCEYLGRGLSQIRFEDRCDMLLQSRLLLFSVIFKTLREREFSLQPRHWLQYQLSCNGDADPLSRMLRCVYLSSQSPDLPREISLLMTSPFSLLAIERVPEDIPFLWCFDEVQCDLDEVTSRSATSRNLGESRKISTLSTMINSVILMDGLNSSVLAGTALNLQGVKEAVTAGMDAGTSIRYTTGGSTRPRTRALDRCHLISDKNLDGLLEPTIRSLLEVIWDATMLGASLVGNETILQDPYFLKRFRQRRLEGLFGLQEQKAVGKILDYLQSNEIWAEIKNHSVALWGRYRWSVCYIEELFRNLVVHGSLTKNLVSKASEDVQKAAKEPLKRRIQELAKSADPKRQQLATDVFHMAIQFKLYGRSRFLDTAAAAILIEQALGYVQEVTEGKVKVCLAERLVVDAVMEHLRETNPPGNITDQHLGTWQYSPSSFGFITEDRLGEAVYSAAHESQDEATRRLFLSNFDSVYKITPTSIGGSISLSLGDFVLEEKPGPAAVGLDEKGDVGQWLEQVVLGNPRQSFLLPTKYAGPDLMFVLCNKSTNPVQRLVCAVQVRSKASLMLILKLIFCRSCSQRWLIISILKTKC